MQIMRKSPRPVCKGYALLITLVFVAISLLIFGSMMLRISGETTIAGRNSQFLVSQAAAESATEKIITQMNHDFISQSLTNVSFYSSLLPNENDWPVAYQFNSSSGTNSVFVSLGTTSTNTIPLTSPYTGLNAFVQDATITATAIPLDQNYTVPATVSQMLQFASIPIFQFAIFYNMNLEINAAATLNINGPVYSNYGLWTGANITYNSTVTTVGKFTNGGSDPYANYSASGKSTFKLSGQPTSGAITLTLPVGNGSNNSPASVESILQLPPSTYAMGTSAAYTTNGQIYLANAADLIISNAFNGTNFGSVTPKGTNFTVYYQDSYYTTSLIPVPYDFYILKKAAPSGLYTNYVSTNLSYTVDAYTNVQYAGYSFLTNVLFYDWREGWNNGSGPAKTVQAVQLDVSKFNAWLANTNLDGSTNKYGGAYYNALCAYSNHKSHPIDSVYIYNSVPLTSTTLPAVRIVNGQQLYGSYGFTAVTPFPIYVEGNYNVTDGTVSDAGKNTTGNTYPAAFMADAITILSSGFNDGSTSKDPSVSPSTTTVNAACLEGIVPSNLSISGNPSYSGGVENFLRLLEKWGNLYYNGSIVVMFPSQYATNRWQQTGNYYSAPSRYWAFDTNFTQQAKLPPLTPQIKAVLRNQWTAN